jgi:NAD(P)-dependent dehydrogenase (short-subunit alcohol dehydrogenase family)
MTERAAIVTGASRGIGRGIALTLAERGWDVVVNYAGNAAMADETVELISKLGRKAVAIQADVGATADRQRLVDQSIQAMGQIQLLVNNAGITSPDRNKPLLEFSEASFDRVMDVNLKGPFFLSQLVARHMSQTPAGDGFRCIVNISSLSEFAVSVARADYCVSKAAISMMTKVFAVGLAEFGINVYDVRPGVIASDMTAGVSDKYDKLIHEGGLLPIARWGQPEDVGKAVAALAEGHFAYSTGDTISIDGGFHIQRL